MQPKHNMNNCHKPIGGVRVILAIVVLSLIIAKDSFAAHCPCCGKEYGEPGPWPGERERIEALRREHEAVCCANRGSGATDTSTSGGGGAVAGDANMPMIMGAYNFVLQGVAETNRILDEARKEREQKAALEQAEEERKRKIQEDNLNERMAADGVRQQQWEEEKNRVASMFKSADSDDTLEPNIGEYLGIKIKTLFSKPTKDSTVVDLTAKGPLQLDANTNLQHLSSHDLEKERIEMARKDLKDYNDHMKELESQIDQNKKSLRPIEGESVYVSEGVILGMRDPDESQLYGSRSPFTGKKFEQGSVFASTDRKDWTQEGERVLADNLTVGEATLNTPYGKQLIERLDGVHFGILNAHSNGATVAEALIRKGIIKVDELNIMGGDRSLINRMGLQELIDTGKVKRITVWTNPGDPVPLGSSYVLPTPIRPLGSLSLTDTAAYYARRLMSWGKPPKPDVEYVSLAGLQYPRGQKMTADLDAHSKFAYLQNIKVYLDSKQNADKPQ
jgi:hypothetical protein